MKIYFGVPFAILEFYRNIIYDDYMTRQMKKANLVFWAIVALATFAVLEFLKSHIGAPYAYGIGGAVVVALAATLLRK